MSSFPTYFPIIKSAEQLKEIAIKFIIRERYLNQIQELFKTSQIIIVHSFGGVGKTTLALEYCHRLVSNDSDSYIRWFKSNSGEVLEIEYKKLSKLLDINVIGEDFDFVIERTNMKLKQFNKDILFVLDNVESYDDVDKYINIKLPKNVKILITTRDQWKNVAYPKIELEPFSIDEAKEYINRNLDKEIKDENIMKKILELAKSTKEYILPIKLEILISYMNCYYIQDIDKSISEIEKGKYLDNQVEYTLFSKLIEEDNEAFELLQYCSILNSDFISYKLLLEILEKENYNEKIVQNKIEQLTKLSLISLIRQHGIEGIKIHRLVQEELFNYCEFSKMDETIIKLDSIIENATVKLSKLFQKVSRDPKELKNNEEFYLNSLNVYEKYFDKFINEKNKNSFVTLLNRIINYELESEKNYININKKSLKLLEACERFYKTDDSNLAESFNNIGVSYDRLNNDKQALDYFMKALKMRKRLFGYNHPDIAKSLINVGYSYGKLNDNEQAIVYKLEGLEIRENLHENDHPDTAESLNSIGFSYGKIGENKLALDYYLKALQMYQRLYDYDHPDIASSLNNVGGIYGELNDKIKALEFQLKALEMYQKIYSYDHPDIATSLNNVGFSYGVLNDKSKALEYQVKSLEMYQRLYEYDHPDIAISLNNVGFSYGELNDLSKAIEYELRALEMYQRLHNCDHPDIAISLENVGNSYAELNNKSKALEYFLKAFLMNYRLSS